MMLSCMQTSRIPSRIDDCGSFRVTECLVGDMSVWQSSAALEMPISQCILVVFVIGHSEGLFRICSLKARRYDCCCYCSGALAVVARRILMLYST